MRIPGRVALVLAIITSSYTVDLSPSFAATTYSFTNAGATGQYGPTQAQVTTAYTATSLAGLVTVSTQGIQQWSVPASGTYSITIAGAAGGDNTYASITGGKGGLITTNVNLTQGTVLYLVVGQKGSSSTGCTAAFCAAGGGGGSFIYTSGPNYIAAAGGGGGAAANTTNLQTPLSVAHGKATTTTGGTPYSTTSVFQAPGGTNGAGGGVSTRGLNYAGPGAGVNSAGVAASGGQGLSYAGNWVGGLLTNSTGYAGGFGGGGGSGSINGNGALGGGGGGGYSGGGGGYNQGLSDGQYGGGGGGYYTGSMQTATDGSNSGHGYITITLASAPVVTLTPPSSINFRTSNTLTANSDSSGKVTFYEAGKRIPGCISLTLSGSGNSYSATCNWKPRIHGSTSLSVELFQTGTNTSLSKGGDYAASTAVRVNRR